MTTPTSPVRLDARLDDEPSRWLWLVKWLLLIPHLIVLAFLWLAFVVLSMVAFFAILFTGRYPRAIFDFNLGVLRWTWRVAFYGYGALGTDRYPPFRLGAEPDYPATLDIAYPERLSRGLVLVKWWLLAVPHYLVIAFFVGGGGFVLWRWGEDWLGFDGGLTTLLALVAGVALLFTGRYPRGIFDFVLGMHRWALRVGAYAGLMTDQYPPFRMDTGGTDPAGPPEQADPAERHAAVGAAHWGAGRVVGVVAGALLLVTGAGAAAGGGVLLWLDGTQRDATGYVNTTAERYTGDDYALRFDVAEVAASDAGWSGLLDWLGTTRARVSQSDPGTLFVGVARTADVERYLDAVPHGRFDGRAHLRYGMSVSGRWEDMPGTGMSGRWDGMPGTRYGAMPLAGVRPPGPPAAQSFWVESASGPAPLALTWDAEPGDWSLVVMNAGGDRGLDVTLDFGATAPHLRSAAIALLSAGAAGAAGGLALVLVLSLGARRARRAAG